MTYIPISKWPKSDQPREKLEKYGPAALTDAELLSILIRNGWDGRSALDLARDLLKRNGESLRELGKLRPDDFREVFGTHKVTGIILIAAFELGRRREAGSLPLRTVITSSKIAIEYLRHLLKDRIQEEAVGIFLNQAGEVIREEWLSKGGIASTVTDIRLIMRIALEYGASSLILCHNHPSGSLKPSKADLDFTHHLARACKQLDLRLLDHVIVSERGVYSFADHGEV